MIVATRKAKKAPSEKFQNVYVRELKTNDCLMSGTMMAQSLPRVGETLKIHDASAKGGYRTYTVHIVEHAFSGNMVMHMIQIFVQ
jgi:Ran GTPase-activating protein (RanGAP) involved in mRNA processing and transport